MSISRTSKYIISILLILCSMTAWAQDDDSTADKPVVVNQHQLCIGIEMIQPVTSAMNDLQKSYEVAADYFLRRDLYAAAEGGFGKSIINYDNLAYQSHNSFVRVGINKCLLTRLSPTDWDVAFLSLRLGVAPISVSNISYLIKDTLWGSPSGIIPNKSYIGCWLEIGGGMRVELLRNFFAGWNIRGKFLVNASQFKELAPAYIAGFGRGDKNPVFDFNVYLCYAIRWNKHNKAAVPAVPVKALLK